jgi:pyruvate/2-oxoglutarate dehydrogenase complex dihydrolipoamide dehydrogenase (E3) component
MVILGGGAIGLEFRTGLQRRFAPYVTIVEHAPRLLALEEPEQGEELGRLFEAEGITVHAGVAATEVGRRSGRRCAG